MSPKKKRFEGSIALTDDMNLYGGGVLTLSGKVTGEHTISLHDGSTLILEAGVNAGKISLENGCAIVFGKSYDASGSPAIVPEPSTCILFAFVALGIVGGNRFFKYRQPFLRFQAFFCCFFRLF